MKIFMTEFNYEGGHEYLNEILSSIEEFQNYLWYCEQISWPCENQEFYKKYFSKYSKNKLLNYNDLMKITLNNNSDSYSLMATLQNSYFDPINFLSERKDKEKLIHCEFLFVRIEGIAFIGAKDEKLIQKFLSRNPDFALLDYLYLLQ